MDECQPLVHGHKSPWKKFEWHVKPQYLVYALNADKTDRRALSANSAVQNVNNGTSSLASSYVVQESGGTSSLGSLGSLGSSSELGPLAALGALIDIKPPAVSKVNLNMRPHLGAPRATLAQAAVADRQLVFPVCQAEPSSCTDSCLYQVEQVMTRCMAWLHVSDVRAGSGALEAGAYTRPLLSST